MSVSVEDLLRFDDQWRKVYREIMAPLRELVKLVGAIACGYDKIFFTQFREEAIDYSTWPRLSDQLSLGDLLRIEVGVLRRVATDARRRLDSLEGKGDAAVDLVRRAMDSFMVPHYPRWLIDERRTLAEWHGFDPVSTVFVCLPIVATIDEVLKKPLDQVVSYPNDVPLRTWFSRTDTRGLAAILSAHETLLITCVRVVDGLSGAAHATNSTVSWVQFERQRREARCVTTTSPRAEANGARLPFFRAIFPCFAK